MRILRKMMSNNNFWNSVCQIISDDFTFEGCQILERYAELFINGRIVYQRFSSFEQHGCATGGTTHVIASILAGADIGSDSITASIDSWERTCQRAKTQEDRIEQWARRVNCWIENVDTKITTQLGAQIAEGGEAHVFYNGAQVVKYIGLDYYVEPVLALDRISLHNAWFPETRMIVLGFGRTTDGSFQIIVEQPLIQGHAISETEIANYAQQLGFKLVNLKNWTFATPEIYLSDLHDENVIQSAEGNIFVIDCDIRINTPELKLGGIRKLNNVMQFL